MPAIDGAPSRSASLNGLPKRTLKLTLAYEGTDFAGWQRQPDARTVQAVVEDALRPIAGEEVPVVGAGRTDAGVHAAGQVASVAFACGLSIEDLHRALNATLPPDVRVLALEDVTPVFNARRAARAKTYRYLIWNGPIVPPQVRRLVWHVSSRLDIEAMNRGARQLLGRHDFAAFQSAGGSVQTTTRELTSSSWTAVDGRADGPGDFAPMALGALPPLLRYEVTGSGFLRHMARNIVGTLVEVGRGRRPSGDMARILASRDRRRAGETAPAHGLTLWRVEY